MIKNLKAVFLGIAFSLSAFVWANPANVEDVVNSKYLNELKTNKVVTAVHLDVDEDYSLLPDCEFTQSCISRKIPKDEKAFVYTLENLYLLPKSELIKLSNSTKTDITCDDVSVVMRSTSKMVSALYYSNTRKKTMPLYKRAYMVDNEVSRKQIPDQTAGSTEGKVYYMLQDDQSFGETVYEEKISTKGNSIYGYYTNLDTMGMGPFKAILPGNLGISIIAIDCGDNIVLYMCMDANSKKLPGVAGVMTDSMNARMEALRNWLVTMF